MHTMFHFQVHQGVVPTFGYDSLMYMSCIYKDLNDKFRIYSCTCVVHGCMSVPLVSLNFSSILTAFC